MDITVYLPDDIGAQAKEAGMNLSRMLRDAVEAEFAHTRAMKELAEGAAEHLLDLETPDGEPDQGRLVGALLCENQKSEPIFGTEDKRPIYYAAPQARYEVLVDEDTIRDCIEEVLGGTLQDEYIRAMSQLGLTATVDL